VAEKRKKQRGLLDIVPEAAPEAAAVSGGWLDPASYDPAMLSYRAGTGLRNMMAGTAALPGLLGEVGRGALQKIRELSPEDLRGRAAPQDTTVVDAASALARRVAQDPSAAASKALDYGRGVLSSPGNVVEFLGENITPRPRGPRPVMQEIDVYHGSPHRFEEFDASKIGTGEGAQAYGHGVYLAEQPEVANRYRTAGAVVSASSRAQELANRAFDVADGNKTKALKWLQKRANDLPENQKELRQTYLDALNNYDSIRTQGNLYTADLPDKMVDRMLDWDKPLSEQPALLKTAEKLKNDYLMWDEPVETATGRELYEALEAQIGSKEAAAVMKGLNIPGIRYLDAGSRGQGGTGTRNFVVFPGEEKNVKILKRE
jgi:hypothetical protein